MVIERGVRGRTTMMAGSISHAGRALPLDLATGSDRRSGGWHRPRRSSSEAVCAGFERVTPQQKLRHFQGTSQPRSHRGASRKGARRCHSRLQPRRFHLFLRRQSHHAAIPLPDHRPFDKLRAGPFDWLRGRAAGHSTSRTRGGGGVRRRWEELCRYGRRFRAGRQRWFGRTSS